MLKHAFKEWAVICQALATGRQALILRKGGIAETSGEFQIEHQRFWLFPTFAHQHLDGVKDTANDLFQESEQSIPKDGGVRLSHFGEIVGTYRTSSLERIELLSDLHIWSSATVEKRFHYRQPGLFVFPIRVFRSRQVFDLPANPTYEGCRSWVELDTARPTAEAEAVMSEQQMSDLTQRLDSALRLRAMA